MSGSWKMTAEHAVRFLRGCISPNSEDASYKACEVIKYSIGSDTVATGRTANGFGETVDVDHGHAGKILGHTLSH